MSVSNHLRMGISSFLIFWGLVPATQAREVKFAIIQTSDMHSHFTSRDSEHGLGGFSRAKTKINELRSNNAHSLLLDAGDWSEGSLFFTINSGEASQRILRAFEYDAIVLGNHDWLIGPGELYRSLQDAQMDIPIVSANLDMSELSRNTRLSDYIKPYVVKDVDGIKVGILGLSTFQYIYDSFFAPVKIQNPQDVAKKYVKILKEQERCDVVVVLSHLGIGPDESLASVVPGIDVIVGGHTHLLLKKPKFVGKVPITHVGQWGEYVGELQMSFDTQKKVSRLTGYKLHEINDKVSSDTFLSVLIDGSVKLVEQQFGQIFNDHVAYSEVHIPIHGTKAETAFSNILTDVMREKTGAEVAFDNPAYASRDLFRGPIDTADFFNVLSHLWDRNSQKTWTVKTFDIRGFFLRAIISGFVRFNVPLNMSGVSLIVDRDRKLDQVAQVRVNGKPMDSSKYYRIAGTDGITAAIKFLRSVGIPIDTYNLVDSGLEPWRLMAEKLKSMSPITSEKLPWEGRIRTVQPDILLRGEDVNVGWSQTQPMTIDVKTVVRNGGSNPSSRMVMKALYDATPENTLDDVWSPVEAGQLIKLVPVLKGGDSVSYDYHWNVSGLKPARYKLKLSLEAENGAFLNNNLFETFVDLR